MTISSIICNAQDCPKIKTIWEIPHETRRQKWLWTPRSFVHLVTKERPVDYNPNYISSYNKNYALIIPVSSPLLQFSLIDLKSGNKLIFVPNLPYNLGISLSSRWASFNINTGIKLFNNDNEIKGKTTFQDYQLNLYGRKSTTDMFVQYYSGFYIKNSKSYDNYQSENSYAIRPDVKTFHMGLSSYYILNNKKFSYGNSFGFVEKQKKSAGSLLLGVYYSYFNVSSDFSLVSEPFRGSFDSLSYIRKGEMHDFGFNLGYIYTLVFLKKCYATASLVQGVGGEQIIYKRADNSTFHQFVFGVGKLHVRLALGYDSGKYFMGAMAMNDYYFFSGKSNSAFNFGFGNLMVFVGYRFAILKSEHKFLKRLKLIEY
jgi:hypothetical protein